MLLGPENSILLELIKRRAARQPAWPPEGAMDAVAGAYGALAKVVVAQPTEKRSLLGALQAVDTEPGYSFTLGMDLSQLPAPTAALEEEGGGGGGSAEGGEGGSARADAISRLASVRAVAMGAPLRAVLARLGGGGAGGAAEGGEPLMAISHRPGEAFFVKPEAGNVAIVHAMRFKDPSDAAIATAFLQEFAEARRAPGLSTAPTVAFSKVPPPELEGADPVLAGQANAGYITFVLNQRHVEAERLDSVVWSMSTFYAFVSYHIKCSKAFMHSSMRKRAASLLSVLSRAKPEVEKEKKTAQGRTFVRPT